MSDENWYKDLTGTELEGKHVHVELKDRYFDGYLNCHGDCTRDGHATTFIHVLCRKDGEWYLADGVISVSLVWDDRDWEIIFPDEDNIRNADAIVCGEDLFCVTDVGRDIFGVDGHNGPVNFSEISYALRYRHEFPSKFGAYKSAKGCFVLHVNEPLLPWIVIADDCSTREFSNSTTDKFKLYQYLPLTPVYFTEYPIPDKLGFYRDSDNTIYLKTTPSSKCFKDDVGWLQFSPDFSDMYDVDVEQLKNHLPLIPVRFTDVKNTQES